MRSNGHGGDGPSHTALHENLIEATACADHEQNRRCRTQAVVAELHQLISREMSRPTQRPEREEERDEEKDKVRRETAD